MKNILQKITGAILILLAYFPVREVDRLMENGFNGLLLWYFSMLGLLLFMAGFIVLINSEY